MNREIEFRGKRLDNGEWAYGYYVNRLGQHTIYVDETLPLCKVDPKTVGQFTGHADRNHAEIFEHDLVQVWYGDEKDGRPIEVTWNGFCFYPFTNGCGGCKTYADRSFTHFEPDPDMPFLKPYTIEIVGNIYSNPELVGKEAGKQ